MKISLNIATHKPRLKALKICLEAIALQTVKPDVVNVYFNNCKPPKWTEKFDINIITGKDLGASGKFYCSKEQTEGIYITLDDDLIVDPHYIEYMAISALSYDNSIVGIHGSIFLTHPIKRYWAGEDINFHYVQGLEHDTAVDILGTGLLAFRADLKDKPVLSDLPYKNATDPAVAKKAKDNNIPLVCLSRRKGFIANVPESQNVGIYHDVAKDDSKHIKIINSIKNFDRLYNRNPKKDVCIS